MFDHIGLKVTRFDESLRFYEAALAPLGYGLCSRDETSAGFGPSGQAALWLYAAQGTGGLGTHVAFKASHRAAVGAFHAAGAEAGGRDNGGPGLRAEYGASYYAAFLIDPDGNNVEAVCLEAR